MRHVNVNQKRMDEQYASIINQIVSEIPNIKPKQVYQLLFFNRISLLNEEAIKASGVVTVAQLKFKMSLLQKSAFYSNLKRLLGFQNQIISVMYGISFAKGVGLSPYLHILTILPWFQVLGNRNKCYVHDGKLVSNIPSFLNIFDGH